MTTSKEIRISKFQKDTWVNVEFKEKDIQFNLLNAEEVTEERVKDIVGMAFSICPTLDEIIEHCRQNGILISIDEIF